MTNMKNPVSNDYMLKLASLMVLSFVLSMMCSARAKVVEWVRIGGGVKEDYGKSLAVDSSGTVFVTGAFRGSAVIGSTTLAGSDQNHLFVARYDKAGELSWAISQSDIGSSEGLAITVDLAGDCYVTGQFQGTVRFGATTLVSSRSATGTAAPDIFVVKVTSGGQFAWAKKAGSDYDDYGLGITVDASGSIFVSGAFQDVGVFGSVNLVSAGGSDGFFAKLDSAGNMLWATKVGGTGDDVAQSVDDDASGNVYLTGSFNGVANFGGIVLTNTVQGAFLAKFDSQGRVVWANQVKGTNSASSMATGRCVSMYVARLSDTGFPPIKEPTLSGVLMVPALIVEGAPGTTARIEYQNDLNEPAWISLTNFTLVSNPQFYVDFGATNRPQRFYRIMPTQ